MEYAWPPASPISPAAVVLHVVLLALAVASFAGLFLAPRRPAKKWGCIPWVAAIALAGSLLPVADGSREEWRPFLFGYILFVWVVCLTGLIAWSVRRRHGAQTPTAAVTLWSLLILGGCIAFALPGVPSAREAARRVQCMDRMRQVVTAVLDSTRQHGRLPDQAPIGAGSLVVSWRVQLLPFLNQQPLRGQYTDDEPWDAETNLPVARTQLDVYSCPASQYPRDDVQRAHAAIALVTGPGTCFPDGKGMALDDVTDGTNATILLGEACGQNIVWTEPRDADVSRVPPGINRPGQRPQTSHGLFSSSHPGGANVFFADGRGQFLSERMDPAVLMKLTTPAAGDAVTDF